MKLKIVHRAILTLLFFIFATSFAFATTRENSFKITSKVFVDNNLISAPQIITHANKRAVVKFTNDKQWLKLALMVKEVTQNKLQINYNFYYQDAKTQLHAKPVIVVQLNREGIIRLADAQHSFEMKVIAVKQ